MITPGKHADVLDAMGAMEAAILAAVSAWPEESDNTDLTGK